MSAWLQGSTVLGLQYRLSSPFWNGFQPFVVHFLSMMCAHRCRGTLRHEVQRRHCQLHL